MIGTIVSNTFVRNVTVSQTPPDGSGLVLGSGAQVDVQFNLFADNQPGGGLLCELPHRTWLPNNLFWSNRPMDVSGLKCTEQFLQHNLVADPQFCDSLDTSYALASSSPALNYEYGSIGAVTTAGCAGTPVLPATWGHIKALFR